MNTKKRKRLVILGGGTGASTIASGFLSSDFQITIVVNMVDSGGSTGILRDELDVLPSGDIRQALLSLSNTDENTKALWNYRFSKGGLLGHNMGNLILAGLERSLGSFEQAVFHAQKMLNVEGEVAPVTLKDATLIVETPTETIVGEGNLEHADLSIIKQIRIKPAVKANPRAIKAIDEADLIVVAPGTIYSSIVPIFLVKGVSGAIKNSSAPCVYVCNLVNKNNHTDGWCVEDFTACVESYMKKQFDKILFQNPPLSKEQCSASRHGKTPVLFKNLQSDARYFGENIIQKVPKSSKIDLLLRSTLRHDPIKTAKAILSFL